MPGGFVSLCHRWVVRPVDGADVTDERLDTAVHRISNGESIQIEDGQVFFNPVLAALAAARWVFFLQAFLPPKHVPAQEVFVSDVLLEGDEVGVAYSIDPDRVSFLVGVVVPKLIASDACGALSLRQLERLPMGQRV